MASASEMEQPKLAGVRGMKKQESQELIRGSVNSDAVTTSLVCPLEIERRLTVGA